jgi:hypothetical protein
MKNQTNERPILFKGEMVICANSRDGMIRQMEKTIQMIRASYDGTSFTTGDMDGNSTFEITEIDETGKPI